VAATALSNRNFIIGGDYLLLAENQKRKSVHATDPEIVQAIRKGDEAAYERTFRFYYPRLCNYASSLLKDEEDAEEIVQTVFITIWEKREELEITLSLKSYLYRAVHNHCLNRFKHASVKEAYREYSINYIPQSYESVTESIHADELAERIEKAIRLLPEQCQKAFRMSRFEELKYQEIADQLNISIKTVENQIGKALKILRNELADYLPSLLILVYFLHQQFFQS